MLPSEKSWAQCPPSLTLLPGLGEPREGGRWETGRFLL